MGVPARLGAEHAPAPSYHGLSAQLQEGRDENGAESQTDGASREDRNDRPRTGKAKDRNAAATLDATRRGGFLPHHFQLRRGIQQEDGPLRLAPLPSHFTTGTQIRRNADGIPASFLRHVQEGLRSEAHGRRGSGSGHGGAHQRRESPPLSGTTGTPLQDPRGSAVSLAAGREDQVVPAVGGHA